LLADDFVARDFAARLAALFFGADRLVAAARLVGDFVALLAADFAAVLFFAAIRLTSGQIWTPDSTVGSGRIRSPRPDELPQCGVELLGVDTIDLEVLRS